MSIPKKEVWQAHLGSKRQLLEYVRSETGTVMNQDLFTIGFARRAAAYKRAALLFTDIDRLNAIAAGSGGIQIVYAGKAHPRDEAGKEQIRRVFQATELLRDKVRFTYLNDYSMNIGKLMTAGVDLWLNTPEPPMEASGTSGMKAAVNAVPSLSVLDGWWIEGCIEGVTGWSIGPPNGRSNSSIDHREDAASLYESWSR